MDPRCAPRPSLSLRIRRRPRVGCQRVAGVRAPAFVERRRARRIPRRQGGVAGVRAPAFVERRGRRCRPMIWSGVAGCSEQPGRCYQGSPLVCARPYRESTWPQHKSAHDRWARRSAGQCATW